MKMTKLVSLLLALVMVVGLFAGCGSDEDTSGTDDMAQVEDKSGSEETSEANDEPAPAEGLAADITVQVESGWLAYYEAAVARVLEANPESSIDLIEMGSFDHLGVLDSTDVTNEDVADVFAFPADRIYGLAQSEALSEIDALTMAANVGGFGDYDAGLGGMFNIDGYYLGFPMNIETLVAFGNSQNAEATGVDLSTTLEINDLGAQEVIIPLFDAWFGVSVMNAAELELLGMDDSGVLFSDMTKDFSELNDRQKAVFTGLYEYWKKHDELGTDLWDADAAWGYIDAEYSNGGSNSVRIDGPWATPSLSEKAADGTLTVAPIASVTIAGYPLTHWQSGWGLGVNARVEGEDEKLLLCQAMIEELINPEFAIDFFQIAGKIMPNVSADVYASSDMSEVDKNVVAAVIDSYQVAVARPLFTEWGSVWDTYKAGVLSWASVKPATVEEAYKLVQDSFTAMMTNF